MKSAKVVKLSTLSQAKLKENVHYDPETGVFTRIKPTCGFSVGVILGGMTKDGYVRIQISGSRNHAHCLAWLYMTGEMPKECIDHINGVRTDNRFCNLREATRGQNAQNQRKPRVNNKSGFLGVYFHKAMGKFRAEIMINGKTKGLGYFDTAEQAHKAYLEAKRKVHLFSTI